MSGFSTILKANISSIEDHLIKNFLAKTPGTLTPRENDLARSYTVLCHAEMESYFELVAIKLVDLSINDWNKNQIIRIPIAGLLSYEEKQTKSDKLSTIINRVVVQYRKEIQNNNHGIRRPNFDKLYGKIGINTNEFDSTFISNLDTFGTQRGAVAHTSVQVQKLINIQDVHQLVSDIINGIDDFETVIQNESGLSIP